MMMEMVKSMKRKLQMVCIRIWRTLTLVVFVAAALPARAEVFPARPFRDTARPNHFLIRA